MILNKIFIIVKKYWIRLLNNIKNYADLEAEITRPK